MKVGFHCSQEQFPPSHMLELVQRAEAAGFDAAMSADHLAPWSERQGESGLTMTWLGAAMHATSFPMGAVTAPGQRYHPVITAQFLATVAEMFPGRFWVALGSGLAANEHVTGDRWPTKAERNQRLAECIEVIRALLAGETVDHDGLVRVSQARLWTLPAEPPPLVGAALSHETAAFLAPMVDGLITINLPHDQLRKVVEAFRSNGGDGKPVYLQAHVSWAPTDDEALTNAHDQWRSNAFPGGVSEDIALVSQFDALSQLVTPEEVRGSVLVSSDLGWQVDTLGAYADLGFEALFLHNVGRNQEEFIDTFADSVLPQLRGAA